MDFLFLSLLLENGTIKQSLLLGQDNNEQQQQQQEVSTSTSTMSMKEQKEAFVTGHEGTTPWEILWISLAGPLGIVCCQYILFMFFSNRQQQQNQSMTMKILIEALVLWFPMILGQSNFLYPWASLILVMEILFWIYMTQFSSYRNNNNKNTTTTTTTTTNISNTSSNNNDNNNNNKKKKKKIDYLTAYRSLVLLMTFIAILAVDFHVFPRRFAKTEVYGYGLMDLGAASFAISAGIVSPKARNTSPLVSLFQQSRQRQQQQQSSSFSSLSSFYQNYKFLLHLLPLIIIGIIRIVLNQELEYQEHVSEYGIHWNFFFTMGILGIIPKCIDHIPPTWILPTAIMILYQFHLSIFQFQLFIEKAPRSCDQFFGSIVGTTTTTTTSLDSSSNTNTNTSITTSATRTLCNIVFANREGILGCFGYLSLYFFGEWIGMIYVWNDNDENENNNDNKNATATTTTDSTTPNDTNQNKKNGNTTNPTSSSSSSSASPLSLWKLCGLLWLLLVLLSQIIPVSRRSTNLTFCVWALAHNVLLLAILKYTLQDQPQPQNQSSFSSLPLPFVLECLNQNGLLLFLIANLLTGLVNLTIPTLEISDEWALIILFGYISTVGMAAILLNRLWSVIYSTATKKTTTTTTTTIPPEKSKAE